MLRATLKSMLSRKRRLILSTLAVVLGVMFVSGSFVLTDTLNRSFKDLFTNIYDTVEIQVTKATDALSITGQPAVEPVPADRVPVVAAVPGVEHAVGGVFVDGAKILDKRGKVVPTTGSPRFGGAWTGGDGIAEIRDGHAPEAADQIMISAGLAKTTGYGIGDTVEVITVKAPAKQAYTVVGIMGLIGGRDSMAGETYIYFTEPVAQQLLLGETGVYSEITVDVAAGEDLDTVRDRIATALGDGYAVKTGQDLAAESSAGIEQGLRFFTYLLLGFAGIALFVGIFIIINTFSITVAQRTRELALLRAIGAGRRQVINSVLVEAAVIGLVASLVGLALGVGIGVAMAKGLGSLLTGGGLELASVGLPPAAVISAFAVGLGVTLVAALLPALRAARIAPVAAMRDSATPDRSLRGLSIGGAAVLAVGGLVLGLGLTGNLGDQGLWGVLGGVLLCFVGVALLTPLVARPVVTVLGRVLSWGAAGKLGRVNSGRNPRRTAITAAALMVGVALVTAISVVFTSVKASTVDVLDAGFDADLVITGDTFSGGLPQIDAGTLNNVRSVDGVDQVAGLLIDFGRVDGVNQGVQAFDDPDAAASVLRMTVVSGTLTTGPGEFILDEKGAADRGLQVGDTLPIALSHAPQQPMRLAGIYQATPAVQAGLVVSPEDAAAGFELKAPIQAYVTISPGVDQATVLERVRDAIQDSPEVNVQTVDQYVAAQAQIFDILLTMVQLLLGLAMIIAVLGVVNTLSLSMIERTREVGLLRAVGMKRRQIMWMVTAESVVICVFGALLGITVGTGLGVAVFQALKDQGLTTLAFPWNQMLYYLVASVVVGLGAAFIPALSASRQNVLRAIAYE